MKISSREEFIKEFNNVCNFLGIKYNNIDIYYEAFIHPSYANEVDIKKDYERLEFLGDAVLGFLVGEFLYLQDSSAEGVMSKKRSMYVCEQANSDYAMGMHLDRCILVGVGARKSLEHKKRSILGNIFESFLGALYLDQGMEAARKILSTWVFPKILENKGNYFKDYKTALQEAMQAERGCSPKYYVISEKGPAHNKTFEIVCEIDDIKLGYGVGKSKKEAEQLAAKEALNKLAE